MGGDEEILQSCSPLLGSECQNACFCGLGIWRCYFESPQITASVKFGLVGGTCHLIPLEPTCSLQFPSDKPALHEEN